MALTPHQVERYGRHLLLDEVGAAGQERLLSSSLRLRGDGLAAEEAARYLAAAGLGALVLDASLARRLGAALGALNDEVSIGTSGDTEHELDLRESASRLEGARAALELLVAIAVRGSA